MKEKVDKPDCTGSSECLFTRKCRKATRRKAVHLKDVSAPHLTSEFEGSRAHEELSEKETGEPVGSAKTVAWRKKRHRHRRAGLPPRVRRDTRLGRSERLFVPPSVHEVWQHRRSASGTDVISLTWTCAHP